MNKVYEQVLGVFVRAALQGLGGILMHHGLIDETDWATASAGLAMVIVGIAMSLIQKASSRKMLLTALAMPEPTSERHLEQMLKSKSLVAPPVMTPPTHIPEVKEGTHGPNNSSLPGGGTEQSDQDRADRG